MYRIALTVLAVVVILAAGYVHGTISQRWQPAEHLQVAVARLKKLPATIGEWDSREVEMNKKHLQVAEVEGYVSRQYYHKKTGERVTILLVCGKPGPIAVHSPDVCYEGAGYKMGPRTAQMLQIESARHEFWTARFVKEIEPAPLQIAWGWSDGGRWLSPDYPRLTFYRSGVLYKWYVIREVTDPASPSLIDEATMGFFKEAIPQVMSVIARQ
jgi:hypothetical protein